MADIALRLIIEGRVQRVGFRYWTETQAIARGLDGWVRNLPDGRVEGVTLQTGDGLTLNGWHVRTDRDSAAVDARAAESRSGRTCQPCLLYTSPSPRDGLLSRMPSSA